MKRLIFLLILLANWHLIADSRTNTFADFQIIVDNNIFNAFRGRVVTNVVIVPEDIIYLAGTMQYGKGTFAIFSGSDTNYDKVVEAGERVGSYTVKTINRDTVELTRGTNHITLKVGEAKTISTTTNLVKKIEK